MRVTEQAKTAKLVSFTGTLESLGVISRSSDDPLFVTTITTLP